MNLPALFDHDLTSLATNPVVGLILLALFLGTVVLLAVLAILTVITLLRWLKRRHHHPSDRPWRRRVIRALRRVERPSRRLRAPPRRWLSLDTTRQSPLESAVDELPRWTRAGRLIAIELPSAMIHGDHGGHAALGAERRRWLLQHLARSGDGGLPIHGLIVTVDAADLLMSEHNTGQRDISRWLHDLRTFALELPAVVPLVVLLTHADRIEGATASLPWLTPGASDLVLALQRSSEELVDQLRHSLTTQRARLAGSLLAHATAAGNPIALTPLLSFSRALGELQHPLESLLRQLQPATQSTPERAFDLRALVLSGHGTPLSEGDDRAEFHGLLAGLAAHARPRRRTRLGRGIRGLIFACSTLAGILLLMHHADIVHSAQETALQGTHELLLGGPDGPRRAPSDLLILADLGAYDRPPRSAFGDRELSAAILRFVDTALVTDVVEPAALEHHRRIASLLTRASPIDRETYDRLRDDLDRYLRLTARTSGEPCGSPPPITALPSHDPEELTRLLARRPWPLHDPPARDLSMIAEARQRLAEPGPEQLLRWITSPLTEDGELPPIRTRQLGPGRVFTPQELEIPGIYTRKAWPLVAHAIADLEASARCWSDEPEALGHSLRQSYTQHYAAAWTRFLQEISIRRLRSLADTHSLVDALLNPASIPLTTLQNTVREHTQGLVAPPSPLFALRAGVVSATGGPQLPRSMRAEAQKIAATFRPFTEFSGLGGYHNHLTSLRRHLDAVADDPGAMPALRDAVQAAIADTRETILGEPEPLARHQLQELLLPPLESIVEEISSNTGSRLRDTFCDRIARPMRELLDGHYPWDPGAQQEISLRELDRLLHPREGLIIGFLSDELHPWLVLEGSQLTPRPRGRGDRLPLAPELLSFLRAALRASDALYIDDTLRVELSLTLSCTPAIHRVGLSVGEQSLHYTCAGSPEGPISWPSEGELQGAWIEAHGRDGKVERQRRRGAWGLWRLLEEASAVDAQGDLLTARFDLNRAGLGELPIQLRPVASHRSLFTGDRLLGPLRDSALRPPTRLFAGQERCPHVR